MRHAAARPGALVLAILLCCATRATAQEPAAFFEENCTACHTIGAGPQAGPDLKGVTTRRDREWLIRFLLDPTAFESDPEVARMIKEAGGLTMPPTEGLDRQIAEALLMLIEQRSAAGTEPGEAVPVEPAFTAADVERGRALFTGETQLSAGGAACVACHDAAVPAPGGGRFAPDLTSAHARLGGRAGLTAWLGATQTPMMRALYRPAPMAPDESRALVAFLEDSAGTGVSRTSPVLLLAPLAFAGCIVVLLSASVIWRARFTAVRRPLVARARRNLVSASGPADARRAQSSDGRQRVRPGGAR